MAKKKGSKKKKVAKSRAEVQETEIEETNEVIERAKQVVDVLEDFTPFRSYARNDVEAVISNVHAAELSAEQKQRCMEIFESEMKDQYEKSSWGYDRELKMREMFESDARYLLVHGSCKGRNEEETGAASQSLLAFVHFRFVLDEGEEVLYIYEIHVSALCQRSGVGKRLMQILELVARRHGMKFIVLTVFKANSKAWNFYTQKLNFVIDESSPSKWGMPSESYEILSKCVIR